MANAVLAAFGAATLIALAAAQPCAAQEGDPPVPVSVDWRDRLYNPKPLVEDVVLPLPCSGAMTFRAVMTPNSDGIVGDVPVLLGQQGSEQPFLDGLRRSYVSGAFPSDDGTTRGYFYMAKYELTQSQYDVVMIDDPDDCPDSVSRRDSVPAVDLTMLDYQRFAERYTVWLMNNAPEYLPAIGSTVGYVRLPTEEEWEFAARGGLAVAEAEFRAQRPPIPDGDNYNEYIAHNGSDSAGGKLQLIGSLKPNPLGLHDMLGNAWEIVGSPFSLVRHGRLHGQAGGIVKRGGGVNWPLNGITSAQRFELAPFNVRRLDVQTERFTGARFVISGISITSEEQNSELMAELDRIAAPDPGLQSAQSEEEVRTLITKMRESAITEADRARLQVIGETLDAARAERNAQRDNSLRMILNSSVLLCNQGVQRYLTAKFASQTVVADLEQLEAEARAAGDEAFLREVLEAMAETRERLARLGELLAEDVTDYANLIEGMAADHGADTIRRQADFIRPEHFDHSPRRKACYDLLRTHLETRFVAGFTDLRTMRDDFKGIADAALPQ